MGWRRALADRTVQVLLCIHLVRHQDLSSQFNQLNPL
jgi:hypothetical protein